MNKRQKIVQEAFLDNEEVIIKKLEQTYKKSLAEINAKIELLMSRNDAGMQHVIYQVEYQKALKRQVEGILDIMHTEEFETVSEYLTKCYEEGFLGSLYDMMGQGIPMCFPIDQEAIVRAVQLDSKISNGLYSRLGEDVSTLKKNITSEVSRGISTGMSYQQVAQQISFKMIGTYAKAGGALYRTITIARTEGHRIQIQSADDACHKAKEKGADVVKQWDATLDGDTRHSHRKVDGEIRELDEPFSNGLMFPGDPDAPAKEVVNCRCGYLQRARWALEGGTSKMNNFSKEMVSFESEDDYKKFKKAFFSKENVQYMNYVETLEKRYKTKDFAKMLVNLTEREYNHYKKLLDATPIYKTKG